MVSKNEVISCSYSLFSKYGVKSVTVDDIAHELHVSKRTVYSIFKNKDEIAREVALCFIGKLREILHRFERTNDNSIYKLIGIYNSLAQFYSNINPLFFITLKKYYYKHLLLIEKYRDHIYLKTIMRLYDKGIKEGLLRDDIPVNDLLYAHLSLFRMFLFEKKPSENIPEITYRSFCSILLMELRGIATNRGYQLIDENKANPAGYKMNYY